jgi:hypothetical protein
MTIDSNKSEQLSFILRKLDPATGDWLQQAHFMISHANEIQDVLSEDLPEPSSSKEIGTKKYTELVRRYSLPIDQVADCAELECLFADTKYKPHTHTGRELLLMLAGKKPLSAFVEVYPDDIDLEIIPERKFEPHVLTGRLVKFEYFSAFKGSGKRQLRRVLYVTPGQEWRFRAHEMLWRMAETDGWKDGFEQLEGYLLGYEVEADPFFKLDQS